jgi:hypothetical protein
MAYEKTLPDGRPIMNATEFSQAYIAAHIEAGDTWTTKDVLRSWHNYQRDPAGHFITLQESK